MPHALSHAGAAALNGKIYVVGGFLRNVHLDAQDLGVRVRPGGRHLAHAGADEEPARLGGRRRGERKDSRDRRPRRQSRDRRHA